VERRRRLAAIESGVMALRISSSHKAGGRTSSKFPHREAMAGVRDLGAYADDGAWDSLWVYYNCHTGLPDPTRATHERGR